MIGAVVTIASVGYEATFCQLFPRLMEAVEHWHGTPVLPRLLRYLGPELQPIGLELLDRMPRQDKDALLLYLAETFEDQWAGKLQEALAASPYGAHVRLGAIRAGRTEEGQLCLRAEDVAIDYKTLVASGSIGQAVSQAMDHRTGADLAGRLLQSGLGLAAKLSSNEGLEDKVLALLRRPETQKRIVSSVEGALGKNGVLLTLGEVRFAQTAGGTSPARRAKPPFPPELDAAIAGAAAAYLRRHR